MVRNYRRGKQFFIFSNTVEKVVLVVADCLYFYEQEVSQSANIRELTRLVVAILNHSL
jgi:hypothetical protein